MSFAKRTKPARVLAEPTTNRKPTDSVAFSAVARLDVVILGFYKGWKPSYGMEKAVRNLKQLSGGKIVVGQYTILGERQDNPNDAANLDVQTKLHEMNWWARKSDGRRVQWTTQYRA